MLMGYACVSTDNQNLDSQKDALKRAGCQRIFEEKRSGGTLQREELNHTLDMLREGDTLAASSFQSVVSTAPCAILQKW